MSFLVVAQSSSEVPEGLMNNPVFMHPLLSLSPDNQQYYLLQTSKNCLYALVPLSKTINLYDNQKCL